MLLLVPAFACGQTDWPVYGHDPGGARYSPLKQINTANVRQLVRAWTYHTGEITGTATGRGGQRAVAFETTPLAVNGVLYLSTAANRVIALEPETGREIWKYDPQAKAKGGPKYRAHRGVAYWPGDRQNPPRILFGTLDGKLIELSAKTGEPLLHIDLRQDVADGYPGSVYGMTSPPAIYQDLVITGSEVQESPSLGPRGDVRAWDIKTGNLVWTFRTWKGTDHRSGTNVWSMMAVDTERGLVFLPIGSPSYDFYGGDRKGEDLYGNCVVALEARTGKLVWYYQLVHHDIWDYDPPAPPALVSIKHDGQEIPALVQVTKMGLVFILDRRTGKPVYRVEERTTPKSDVPGEESWPTQPVPVKPPPLSRAGMSRDEITEITPEVKRYCTELFDSLHNNGRYTPYGTKRTLVFPGTLGGATWSGVSFDPGLGYVFVNTNEVGAVGRVEKVARPGGQAQYRRTDENGEYARFWTPDVIPCQKPPWGLLNAVNVNTGDVAWRVPLGTFRGEKTGTPNIGGSIATAGGLVFIGATNDSHFRAFDSRTGKELWSTEIDGSGHATPVTYQGRDGRQYVVIAAGGGGYFGSKPADALVAFRLP